MNGLHHPFVAVLLLALLGVLGDVFIKLAGNGPSTVNLKWLVVGTVLYMATVPGWFYLMKYVKLSTLGAVYSIYTTLFLVAAGVFWFSEKLNPYEMLGVAMAILSICLLGRFT